MNIALGTMGDFNIDYMIYSCKEPLIGNLHNQEGTIKFSLFAGTWLIFRFFPK